jgi:hypothetical protein
MHDQEQASTALGCVASPCELSELMLRLCRNTGMVASVAQQALHRDPRYRGVRLLPEAGPGRIAISGRLADRALLWPLLHFAREWGGISVQVEIAPPGARTSGSAGH